MFQSVQKRCYGFGEKSKLYNVAKGNVDFVQRLKLERKLEAHTGCVNTICWNSNGQKILSGSDDQHLVIMDPYTQKKLVSLRSGHRANIFSAKFMPASDDKQIVSCSGDGKIFYTNLERPQDHVSNMFDCHFGTTYEVIVVPNEASTFLSCGEDGTVRWFDLRVKSSCVKESCKEDVLINCRRAVTSLAVNPFLPYHLAIACSDSSVRIFDRRMLGTRSSGNYTGRGITGMMCRFSAPTLAGRSYRITSLAYSPDGEDILVSYSSEYIYLFGHKENTVKTLGHTMPATQKPSNRVTTLDDLPVKLPEAKPVKEPSKPARPSPQPQSTSQGAAGSSLMDSMPGHPPIKRLRLRGDWSDTGPNARPESERSTAADSPGEEQRRNPHASIMQRMSDMLTRWLDGNLRRGDERSSDQGEGQQLNEEDARELEEEGTARQPTVGELDDAGPSMQSAGDDSGVTAGAIGGNQDDSEQKFSEGDKSSHTKSEVMDISDGEDHMDSQNKSYVDTAGQSTSSSDVHAYIPSSSAVDITTPSSSAVCSSPSSVIDYSVPPSSTVDGSSVSSSVVTSATVSSSAMNSASSSSSVEGSSTAFVSAVSSTTTPSSTVDVSSSSAVGGSTSTVETVCSDHRHSESDNNNMSELVIPLVSSQVNDNTTSMEAHSSTNRELPPNTNQPEEHSERQAADSAEETPGESGEDRPLEPVISLHYSSEGTTSSTIRLGFARFENLEAGLLQRSAEDASLAPLVREATPHEPEQEESTSMTPACPSADGPSQEPVLTENADEKSESNSHFINSSDQKTECEIESSDHAQSDTSNLEIESPVCCSEEFSSEEKGSNDSDCNDEANVKGDNSPEQTTDHQQNVGEGTSDLMRNSATGETTAHGRQEDNSENDTLSEARTNAELRPRGPRQRRVGHSGPPTGNYQPSADEDTSDEEGGSSRRGRDSHDTLERHITAIRLQELYRKRQEEREKEEMELRNIHQPTFKIKYKGHRNARTMIKEANFWGNQFVMSGSDCGHIFIWDRYSAKLVMLLEGDRHVVNCLQPHPYDPMLASSGIDYDIKIWSPMAEKSYFDEESANEIIRRNEVMLEETRDTITVPAAFMLRVLASLNQLRSGRSANNSENPVDQESDSDD